MMQLNLVLRFAGNVEEPRQGYLHAGAGPHPTFAVDQGSPDSLTDPSWGDQNAVPERSQDCDGPGWPIDASNLQTSAT